MVTIWDMFYLTTITTPLLCAIAEGWRSGIPGILLGLVLGGAFAAVDFLGMRVIVRRRGRCGLSFFGVSFLIGFTSITAQLLVHFLLHHRAA